MKPYKFDEIRYCYIEKSFIKTGARSINEITNNKYVIFNSVLDISHFVKSFVNVQSTNLIHYKIYIRPFNNEKKDLTP